MGRYFGTDGVRGVAGKELTSDFTYRLGRAGGYVLTKHQIEKRPKVLVAADTRISSDMLVSAIASGLLSVGCDVTLAGVMPTPAVAFLVSKHKYDAGVMVSASHNSFEYNGIKFFNSEGYKLTDEIENEIEEYLDNKLEIKEIFTHDKIGRVVLDETAGLDYLKHISESISEDLKGVKVLLDTANGATSKFARDAFVSAGCDVDVINDNPDGININDNCGSTHLDELTKHMKSGLYDVGFAFDGDGDRMLAVDSLGNVCDGDRAMFIIASYLKDKKGLRDNTIVATVMSNLGFENHCKEHGINLIRTKVGDRYVLESMRENNYEIGGEQSGHIIVSEYANTGDGILSALLLTSSLVHFDRKLSDWNGEIPSYPQILKNVTVPNELKQKFMGSDHYLNKKGEVESKLSGKGRVLIRPSGTEPLIRVMLEGEDLGILDMYAEEIVSVIKDYIE